MALLLMPLLLNDIYDARRQLDDIYDQHFGLGLRDFDLVTPLMNVPAFRAGYLRPWRNLAQAESGMSSIKSDDNEFSVRLDVAHFKPEELKVKLDNGYVIVEGQHELYKLVTLSMAKVELYGKLDVLAMEEQRRRSPVSRALPGTPLGMAAFKRVPRKIRDRYKVYQGDYGEVKTLPWVEPRPAWYQSPAAAAPCSPSGDAAGQSPQQAWPTVQVEALMNIPSRQRTPRRPRRARRQMEEVDAITPCDGDETVAPLLDEIEVTEQVIGDLNSQIEQNEALRQQLRAEIAADRSRAEEVSRRMGTRTPRSRRPSSRRPRRAPTPCSDSAR